MLAASATVQALAFDFVTVHSGADFGTSALDTTNRSWFLLNLVIAGGVDVETVVHFRIANFFESLLHI